MKNKTGFQRYIKELGKMEYEVSNILLKILNLDIPKFDVQYKPNQFEGFTTFELAIRQVPMFAESSGVPYVKRANKLALLLESLNAMEAEIFLRLLNKDFGPYVNEDVLKGKVSKEST